MTYAAILSTPNFTNLLNLRQSDISLACLGQLFQNDGASPTSYKVHFLHILIVTESFKCALLAISKKAVPVMSVDIMSRLVCFIVQVRVLARMCQLQNKMEAVNEPAYR